MARIRTIKPEFFTSEDIVSLTPLARLFYVSLWCEADREGRLEWKPRTFKLRYFPADDCDIEAMCSEVVDAGLVVLYEANNKTYAEIPSFARHQVINNRESASEIPENNEKQKNTPRVKDASGTRESGVSGEGKEGKEGNSARVKSDADTSSPKIGLDADGAWFGISRTQRSTWEKAYPALSLDAELSRAAAWVQANPKNKKSNYARFLTNWFSRAQDRARPGRETSMLPAIDPSDPAYAMSVAI